MSMRRRVMSWLLVKLVNRHAGDVDVHTLRRFLGPPDRNLDDVRGVQFARTTLGGVPAEQVLPTGVAARELGGEALFIHGGAYVAGTSAHFRRLFSPLARDLRLRGWSIDYRLAPEHPFPAALEDALCAYRALVDAGADPRRTIVSGESAGGNLALATLVAARDAGLPMPAGLLLFWPQTDLTLSGDSLVSNAGRDFLTVRLVETSARLYLGGADPSDPRASPLFADLRGLPPTLVQVGERDLIRSDGERLVAALRAAGVAARLDVEPRAIHGFAAAGDTQEDSRRALARAVSWADAQLGAVVA